MSTSQIKIDHFIPPCKIQAVPQILGAIWSIRKGLIGWLKMTLQNTTSFMIFLTFWTKKRYYVQRASNHRATTSTGRIKIDAPTSFHLVKFKPSHKFSALNEMCQSRWKDEEKICNYYVEGTDYGHTMAKSLILYSPNSYPNTKNIS